MTCTMCERPLDEHDRHIRFTLPDPVLHATERERTPGTWMSDDDPRVAVMMQVPRIGAFVRVLLPVRLTGGFAVTFGTWLSVHPDDLHRAYRTWWEPEYVDLVLDGRLANALPVWGLLAVPARAVVRDPDSTPYVDTSTDDSLRDVLTREWPHELVLGAIAGL